MGSLVEELRRREVVNSFTRGHSAIPGFDLSAGSRGAAAIRKLTDAYAHGID